MAYAAKLHRLKKLAKLPPNDVATLMQDTRWADGIRGVASVFVVASHLTLCFARRLIPPCCASDQSTSPAWYQYPPFRLVGMGHSWVAMFFLLLGFVNSLKPIKLARQHKLDAALATLSQASFRRTFRLVLPAAAATVISWFLCQLGMYTTAHRGDAFWTLTYTPWPSDSWSEAVVDLFRALKYTWMFWLDNVYDQPQWALIYLLYGSMIVFTALLITLALSPGWRVSALGLFMYWSLDWTQLMRDPLVPWCTFAGMLLAELQLSTIPLSLVRFSPILSPILFCAGLVFMSQPSDFTDGAGWSRVLQRFGLLHFPNIMQAELDRAWGSIGGICVIVAVLLSPALRRIFSAPPLAWLGKVSFPIYLLHGIFIRTFTAWLAFRAEPREFETDHGPELRYPQRSLPAVWFAVLVSMSAMLVASHYWAARVEPVFGRITQRAEALMVPQARLRGGDLRGGLSNGHAVLPVRKD